MTYLWLSLVFLLIAALVLVLALVRAPDRRPLVRRWWLPVTIAGVLLAVLTAVFDNLMIGIGLMTYGDAHLSGVRLGLVPIEDFAYPLAGLLLLPAVWLLLRRRSGEGA
ncbi:lycopene cyclase domain-containing protein [Leifsonia sp. NPDC058194]|uniref:lycopene cyclase domain-containing protein n=1 Tax=Leifsonia sp. NPDC058194 TaxID=3346374 RepID=UPI0036DAF153